MKFDEALSRFLHEVEAEYGERSINAIQLSHVAFDWVMRDMWQKADGKMSFYPSSANDFKMYGIRLNARERSKD